MDGLYLLRMQTFSTNYPTYWTFCVPDCHKAHQSYTNTQNGECEWGGPYCLAADSWNGCTAGPTGSGWSLATGTNQLAITGHHYNSVTFQETKYTGSCAATPGGSCASCASGQGLLSGVCGSCGANPVTLPEGDFCALSAAVTPSEYIRCKDAFGDGTSCVTKCPAGKHVFSQVTSGGAVQQYKCQTASCAANCRECFGSAANQCKQCNKGYYLKLTVPGSSHGTCTAKLTTSPSSLKVYLNGIVGASGTMPNALTIQSRGTDWWLPFYSIQDALTKAYELGAKYVSADVTIILDDKTHIWRPYAKNEVRYKAEDYDDQQSVRITIIGQGDPDTKVIYKLRDKLTFRVGAGLTFQDMRLEGLDSVSYYDDSQAEFWTTLIADKSTFCTTDIKKCGDPAKGTKIPRAPKEDCVFTDSAGAGMFIFDRTPTTTYLTVSPPTLTIDTVTFHQFAYNFNSFIDLNDAGGHVIIKDSVFSEFSTCGAIIRNKRIIPNKYPNALTTYTTYADQFQARAHKKQYELMMEKFLTAGTYSGCTGGACHSITIESSKFLDFGVLKTPLTDPVAVDPLYGMHYTGQVLDLDTYSGAVKILSCEFKGIGIRYDSCEAADTMINTNPATLTDNYPKYGTKSKYQIKSVISIVNHDAFVQITGSTFEDNIGTKGVIYIDMKHSATLPRVLIGGVTFKRNIGYVDSSVIHIRARGPPSKDVYSTVPGSTESFCGGYTIQKNTFTNNFGCTFTTGGVVKFECVKDGETGTDWIDRIKTPAGVNWVSDVYSAANYLTYAASGTQTSISANSNTYVVDTLNTILKSNVYSKNLGSGSAGLVDIRGASRLIVQQESYTNNGDAQKELVDKYMSLMTAPYVFKEAGSDKLKESFDPKNAATYSPEKLMNSMLNIERSTSISISTIDFKENFLIENGCQSDRSLSIRVKDYAGVMVINDFDINTQIGAGVATHYIKTSLGLDAAQSKSENLNGHVVPMILFSPTVMIKKADFTDWTAKSVKFVEVSGCFPLTNMYFSFPGVAAGAFVETLNFKSATTTLTSIFDTLSCLGCTQPIFYVGPETLTTTIDNIKFVTFNSPAPSSGLYGPLFMFELYQPYSSPLITPKVQISSFQVDTFIGGIKPTSNSGRIFDFKYRFISGETVPTVDQVTIKTSSFTKVTGNGDGILARADLNKIMMSLESTSFTTIKNEALAGYGVIQGVSMGQLTLKTVTATGLTNPVSNSDVLGGGRLFYLKQADPFKLFINTASNLKCSSLIYSNPPHEDDAMGDTYAQGSLIELENTGTTATSIFTVEVKNSNFENCYHANMGGAISVKAAMGGTVALDLQFNTFKYNTAVLGGSVYCEQCKIGGSAFKWSSNTFQNGYAKYGGDVYINQILNTMSSTSYLQLVDHNHKLSRANLDGGAFYIKEDLQTVRLEVFKSTLSEFKTMSTQFGNGAVFMIEATKYVHIKATSVTFETCTSGTDASSTDGNGGVFAVKEGIIEAVDVLFTEAKFTQNRANIGSGGILYIPKTSTTSVVTLVKTVLYGNEANVDGGALFIGGTGDKMLKLEDCDSIQKQATTSGSGGVAYMTGSKSTIDVYYPSKTSLPTASLFKENTAQLNGGLFYAIVTGATAGTVGCELFIKSYNYIETSKATVGNGGIYHCEGDGMATIEISPSMISSSSAGFNGGSFFTDMTETVTMKISPGTTISGSKADGSGGFASLKSLANTDVSMPGCTPAGCLIVTKIEAAIAKVNGGAFNLVGAVDNTLTIGAKVIFYSCMTQLGHGGLAHMGGTNDVFSMDKTSELRNCFSGGNGGCFAMTGTTLNKLTIIGDIGQLPPVADNKALGHGGFIFTSGADQKLTFTSVGIKNHETDGNGGFFYSEVTAANSKIQFTMNYLETGRLELKTFKAFGGRGSFMHVASKFAPDVNIVLDKISLACQDWDFCVDVKKYTNVYDNLKTPLPTLRRIGGLFYFEDGVTGTVTTTNNEYKQCHTTTEGSVFYLTKGVQLIDTSSNIYGNAGLKGNIYCDNCKMTQSLSMYKCMLAEQASFMYIVSTVPAPGMTVIDITKTTISHGRSIKNGGGIYAAGSEPATLKLDSCGVITTFETEENGGFFFIANSKITLQKPGGTNFNNLYSSDVMFGGYLEGWIDPTNPTVKTAVDPSFAVDCRLGNITVNPGKNEPGSLAGSSLIIKDCVIDCMNYDVLDVKGQQATLVTASAKQSLYRITGQMVTSTNIQVMYCTAGEGAIFKLKGADLVDTGSKFEYNGANKGGVFHCEECKIHLKGTQFKMNFADKGGIIYIKKWGQVILEDVVIQESRAMQQGGVAYLEGDLADMETMLANGNYVRDNPTVTTYIKYAELQIKTSLGVNSGVATIQNIESLGDAAGIYVQNGVVKVNDVTVDLVTASKRGGFIYSDGTVQVTMTNTVLSNMKAESGGFMYADSEYYKTSAVPVRQSFVQFATRTIFNKMTAAKTGGVFHVNNKLMTLKMNSYIELTVATTTSGHGGVLYLENVKGIDFSQAGGPKSSYSKISVPNPSYGSFLYSIAKATTISIEDIIIKCQATVPTDASMQALLTDPSKKADYGGAIYVKDALLVTSKNSEYRYCYGANYGGVFHLTTDPAETDQNKYTKFQEEGSSVYEWNQAEKGGVIYCDKCMLQLKPSISQTIDMRNNYAREGGVFFIKDVFNGLIESLTISGSRASEYGGVFSFYNQMQVAPTPSSMLVLKTTITDSMASSNNNGEGGVFYFDTVQLDKLTISESTIDGAESLSHGGVIFVQKMGGQIVIESGTAIKNFRVDPTMRGSLFYSAVETNILLKIADSFITCNQTALMSDAMAAVTAKPLASYRAGAIYMENSVPGIISTNNLYEKCTTAQDGGIFYIVETKLADSSSKYIQMQALYGSIMKCRNCDFSFLLSKMDDAIAESGGAFMIENNAVGLVERTSFIGTQALNQGGVLSIVQSGLVALTDKLIEFRDCKDLTKNSAHQGGVFYINQPRITIRVLRSTISQATALDTASVAFIANGLSFILEDSTILNIFAPKSQILFSSSIQLHLKILNSNVNCNSSYDGMEVIPEFRKITVPFNSTNSFLISGEQQTQVTSYRTQYQKCSMLEDGGLFRLEGRVQFTDFESSFTDNSAAEGGVFSCSMCNITLKGTKIKKNQAKRGGVVKLEAQGNFTSIDSIFQQNVAQDIGGVIFVTTQSVFNMVDSLFDSNEANTSSTIDVLGASSYLVNRITGCKFTNNTAQKNTISLKEAKAAISLTIFRDNFSQERSKNLFVAFAEVNITDCAFMSPEFIFPKRELEKDQTMGAFIFIILDVKITIVNTKFSNGLAKYGGAIYISGQSDITMINCQLNQNMADIFGGAIFANGFRSIRIIGGSKLYDNYANLKGDDFYLSNTEETMELDDVTITSSLAKNSLYAEQVSILMRRVKYQNAMYNPDAIKGAAVLCFGCRRLSIDNSIFKNLKSEQGSAVHLTDIPTNKKDSDRPGKYKITNTLFENTQGNVGGTLYLDHPQYFQIVNSTFYQSRALNKTTEDSGLSQSGIGGAIYYHCSAADPKCQLEISGFTSFDFNYASRKGGAMHYTYYEPKIGPNVTFVGNRAGWYGDSISSYSTQLKPINFKQYTTQYKKIDNPLTYKKFLEIMAKNISARKLQADGLDQELDLFSNQDKAEYTATSQRSGGVIPDFQLAHVDKYGQVVADFDSKIRVSVDQEYYKSDYNTKKYTPVLEGTTQYISYGGVSQVSNLQFSGAPGYKYRLAFLSSGIDEKLPVNQEFKELYSSTSIEFDFFVELRNCQRGEYFTQVGKCIWCEPTMGYALVEMKEPGDCKPCPWDRGTCKGGYKIGPNPGYWRKNENSTNFIRCPNPNVCLGWVAPTWNPMGQCAEGQKGTLCAECMPGYSLTGVAKCGKCPDLTSNVVKMVGIIFLVIGIFFFMVRSTIAGATQKKNNTSIYMKILMNHFQLILLVSSFNFQWPKQLEVFFAATSPVSEASTQVVSVDCFMAAKASFAQQTESYFKTYYIKLVIFALIPILLGIFSYLFWWINKCIKKTEFQSGKAIATLVISLFTIHPNIVQMMFNDYNCKDIDGDLFVYTDMSIKCWSGPHTFWSYTVAAPSIVVWGLGIPFFALVLMYRDRNRLDQVETKEKFGFLYNGYTQALFFWEIVIMYRKIAMIFISVFIQPQGVISQALLVFLLMIAFLVANLKKKPYLSISLNDLETISLLTSTLSIYCGIFFIADIPSKDVPILPMSVKSGITLSEPMRFVFFIVIMVANLTFFGYWFFKIQQEIRNTLLQKAEKLYLLLFLCGDKRKLDRMKHQLKLDEENELLREKYFKSVSKLKELYKEGRVVLTQKTLERAQVYLDEDRYLEALGLGRRDVEEKELKRFNRMAVGAEIKHNEREKAMYSEAFSKNMRKGGGKFQNFNNEDLFLDEMGGGRGVGMTPEEKRRVLFDADQSPNSNKLVAIRPESSQQTVLSGNGYTGENENMDTQAPLQTSTKKLITEEDGPQGASKLINNHGILGAHDMLGGQLNIRNNGTKINQDLQLGSKNLKTKKGKASKGQVRKHNDSSSLEHHSNFDNGSSFDGQPANLNKNQIWEDLEEDLQVESRKIDQQPSNKTGQKNDLAFADPSKMTKEEEKKLNEGLDIATHIKSGSIKLQAQKAKNEDAQFKKSVQNAMKRKPVADTSKSGLQAVKPQRAINRADQKPANLVADQPKPQPAGKVNQEDRIEMELNFNRSLSDSDQQSEAPRAQVKHKKKGRRQDEDDDIDVFSDEDAQGKDYSKVMMGLNMIL